MNKTTSMSTVARVAANKKKRGSKSKAGSSAARGAGPAPSSAPSMQLNIPKYNVEGTVYHDFFRMNIPKLREFLKIPETKRKGPRGGVATPFPDKLYEMLVSVEAEGMEHIVSWQPHGRAFRVRKMKEFLEHIMPRFFKQSKMSSFQRQLNLYGFERILSGEDKGAYFHELFLRGRPDLNQLIFRTKVKSQVRNDLKNSAVINAPPIIDPDLVATSLYSIPLPRITNPKAAVAALAAAAASKAAMAAAPPAPVSAALPPATPSAAPATPTAAPAISARKTGETVEAVKSSSTPIVTPAKPTTTTNKPPKSPKKQKTKLAATTKKSSSSASKPNTGLFSNSELLEKRPAQPQNSNMSFLPHPGRGIISAPVSPQIKARETHIMDPMEQKHHDAVMEDLRLLDGFTIGCFDSDDANTSVTGNTADEIMDELLSFTPTSPAATSLDHAVMTQAPMLPTNVSHEDLQYHGSSKRERVVSGILADIPTSLDGDDTAQDGNFSSSSPRQFQQLEEQEKDTPMNEKDSIFVEKPSMESIEKSHSLDNNYSKMSDATPSQISLIDSFSLLDDDFMMQALESNDDYGQMFLCDDNQMR